MCQLRASALQEFHTVSHYRGSVEGWKDFLSVQGAPNGMLHINSTSQQGQALNQIPAQMTIHPLAVAQTAAVLEVGSLLCPAVQFKMLSSYCLVVLLPKRSTAGTPQHQALASAAHCKICADSACGHWPCTVSSLHHRCVPRTHCLSQALKFQTELCSACHSWSSTDAMHP